MRGVIQRLSTVRTFNSSCLHHYGNGIAIKLSFVQSPLRFYHHKGVSCISIGGAGQSAATSGIIDNHVSIHDIMDAESQYQTSSDVTAPTANQMKAPHIPELDDPIIRKQPRTNDDRNPPKLNAEAPNNSGKNNSPFMKQLQDAALNQHNSSKNLMQHDLGSGRDRDSNATINIDPPPSIDRPPQATGPRGMGGSAMQP